MFFLALKCPNVIKHLTLRETERYAKEDNSDKCKISCKEQISFWTHPIFDKIYESEQTSSLLPLSEEMYQQIYTLLQNITLSWHSFNR